MAGPPVETANPAKPPWLRARVRVTPAFEAVERAVHDGRLNTVCFSAACPNLGECWSRGTATFMIGGNLCTRRCGFCDVTTGRPAALDPDEPRRVAVAVAELGLRFAVVTCVARDDLPDGGAGQMAATVRAIRERCPGTGVEVLIADYKGDEGALATVLDADPDVLNHNLETVERLQRRVRAAARYDRSLGVLRRAAALRPDVPTKSGLMLGLGERDDEVETALVDLRAVALGGGDVPRDAALRQKETSVGLEHRHHLVREAVAGEARVDLVAAQDLVGQ